MFLQNKVALVTGGLSGLGLCFVKDFLKHGIRGITVVDINDEISEDIITWIEKEYGPGKAIFVKADVSKETEFEDAFQKTIEAFNNLDIVINNAGVLDERNFRRTTDINLNSVIIGTTLAMNHYLPKYKTSEDPVVVNISSLYGLDPCESSPVYTAAKHGVVGLGKALSTEGHYKVTGVKILTICPGHSATAIMDNFTEKISLGRYQDLANTLSSKVHQQEPVVVSKALIKIFEDFTTGDVWLVEDGKCYNLEIPSRFDLKRLRTLEI